MHVNRIRYSAALPAHRPTRSRCARRSSGSTCTTGRAGWPATRGPARAARYARDRSRRIARRVARARSRGRSPRPRRSRSAAASSRVWPAISPPSSSTRSGRRRAAAAPACSRCCATIRATAFLAAVADAERYRLFDLDRLERMVLKQIAHDYFVLDPRAEHHDE